MEKVELYAVYGSLRKGLHNHKILGDSKLIGECYTEPIYDMYSVSNSFPAVVENGSNSIKLELYNVTNDKIHQDLDNLEGYISYNNENNFYNKEVIPTPYGLSYIYFYNEPIENLDLVVSGDWLEYKNEKSKV